MAQPPPPRTDPGSAGALADALRRGGFDPAALNAFFADGANAPLVRLFVGGEAVAAEDAEEALGTDGLTAAIVLGVVAADGDGVRATVRIVPHDVLLLASDLPTPAPAPDHVAAAHAPSLTLARLTVREPAGTALDLGTGNGVQALLLARHARRVIATDVNERALRFAELNAALNGVTNVETRAESFLEPADGAQYDAIVCSPPYVVSPDTAVLYRTTQLRGDRLSEELVRAIPSRLAPGGFASVLISWLPDNGSSQPLEWVHGCDALLFELHRDSAATAAAAWNDDAAGVERWETFYAREGIEEIAYGALVLRRRDGEPRHAHLSLPGGPVGAASAQIVRMFAAHDVLATPGWEQLRLAWAPDVRVKDDEAALTGGLGLRVGLDTADLAAPQVRAELLELGFLVPAN